MRAIRQLHDTEERQATLLDRFPALRHLEEPSLRLLEQSALPVTLPAGAKAFEAACPAATT